MPRITPPLAVSPPERLILETVAASEQLPASVRKRARVVLLAGDGADNCTIGLDVGMHRSRVHFWRRRFSASGIRGLWDAEGVLPREPIPEEVEREIVSDCLYRPRMSGVFARERIMGGSLTWNVRSLALRYGVSQATVQRVWKKYGIKMVRYYRLDRGVDLRRLKISQDPLFGVTVYEIAGLFYETLGPVLALCSREQPFSELALSGMSEEARREAVDSLAVAIRNLEERNKTVWMKNAGLPNFRLPALTSEQFLEFLRAVLAKPRHAGAQMHLLVDSWECGARASEVARAYLAQQPSIRLQVAPRISARSDWGNWVTCWLRAIAAWPLQTSFIETAFQVRELLRDRGRMGPRVLC
jgi:hypothetical protein